MKLDPQIHAILVKLDDLTEDFVMTDHERTPEEIQGFCDRVIAMSLLKDLNLTMREEVGVLLQDFFNYVQLRFSAQSTSVMVVAGYTIKVDSVVNPPKREQFATPSNLDNMRRQQQESQARELFRPFLVRSIYSHLVGKAFLGHTTTYEAIANEFGLPNKGNQLGSTLSPLLSNIYLFCQDQGQPHLTVLVVRKSGASKGLPGQGFWDLYKAHNPGFRVETLDERDALTKSLQVQVFAYWRQLGK